MLQISFGGTPPSPLAALRDTLFGDAPLNAWPSQKGPAMEESPWCDFIEAREALADGRESEAIACWQRVTMMPDLESRHYAQAWHFLRAHGVQPGADQAKELLGVVIEVEVNGGVDLLAAYPNRSARYYNHSGKGIIWERPDASLDAAIDAVLSAGQTVLNMIGPWEGPRKGPPGKGGLRLNMISPSGLHFGEGPFAALAAEPMARPLIDAGTALMQQMIAKDTGGAR
ncbi:MAG: hypothetical protein WD768_02420 [Phycisphaeraceae bacterium]